MVDILRVFTRRAYQQYFTQYYLISKDSSNFRSSLGAACTSNTPPSRELKSPPWRLGFDFYRELDLPFTH